MSLNKVKSKCCGIKDIDNPAAISSILTVLTPFWANDFAAAKTMCSFTTVLSVLFFLTLFILNIKGDKDTFIL